MINIHLLILKTTLCFIRRITEAKPEAKVYVTEIVICLFFYRKMPSNTETLFTFLLLYTICEPI